VVVSYANHTDYSSLLTGLCLADGDIFKSMKKSLVFLAVLSLLTMLVMACSEVSANSSPSTTGASNTVHMNETQFEQTQITIKKGGRVTLVDDAAVVHIIQNGTWDNNGNARPGAEAGAPNVQLQFSGGDTNSIGPFNTAGTFNYYCTVHNGMNLTVIVK
jgi:plastocyanin